MHSAWRMKGIQMSELDKYREEIDDTDSRIIDLFQHRIELSEKVAEYKIRTGKAVYDARREKDKLASVTEKAGNSFNRQALQQLFEQLMAISRRRQYQLMTENGVPLPFDYRTLDRLYFHDAKVVFQGVEGAYSFEAMKQFFDNTIETQHVRTWREAMKLVSSEQADYAVLPIENSTAGSVSDIYDLLLEFDNYIVGEQILKIDHMLMALPGASMDSIRTVYSHPQALAQCRDFLAAHPEWKQVRVLNTAMAAEKVAREGRTDQAAIASRSAAECFGLNILKDGGLSAEKNSTRFVIVSHNRAFVKDAGKVSICFGLPHECGTLYNMLSHFIFNGLNMTKIESRPVPDRPFEYRFFIDFEGNLSDAAVRNALRGIQAEAVGLRLLGNY
ncbi:MAG: prephenate dehydratase [Eubacteriales bacterium]|jgi:chorismate mutase/prephenate dehydratase